MGDYEKNSQRKEVADTIVAIATPAGRGAIGIVRLSGPAATAIATTVLGKCPRPRQATLVSVRSANNEVVDQALALFMPGPHSFTGEDTLELQGHGGPVVLDLVSKTVIACGARLARPGEFSERAFLNGKLDLSQAEAVADLIDASSEASALGAVRSLQGAFSRHIDELNNALVALRVYVEAAIDFPDEEVDFLADHKVREELDALLLAINHTLVQASLGRQLRDGVNMVIVGRPNVGKSSLLNALAEYESAIVTDIPGTTRDLVREHLLINGVGFNVLDTAGLRDTDDPVETIGIARAWSAVGNADVIVLVIEDAVGMTGADLAIRHRLPCDTPLIVVRNKIDTNDRLPYQSPTNDTSETWIEVGLSAKENTGIELLRDSLYQLAGFQGQAEHLYTARRRHIVSLDEAKEAVQRAIEVHESMAAGELVAQELRLAQRALSEICGQFTTEDLLGEIFSSFCIGK